MALHLQPALAAIETLAHMSGSRLRPTRVQRVLGIQIFSNAEERRSMPYVFLAERNVREERDSHYRDEGGVSPPIRSPAKCFHASE